MTSISLLDQAPVQLAQPDLSALPFAEKQARMVAQLHELGSALLAYSLSLIHISEPTRPY